MRNLTAGQLMTSSILFESEDKTVVLLDLPRSLEEAQRLSDRDPPQQDQNGLQSARVSDPALVAATATRLSDDGGIMAPRRRLVSSAPLDQPFPVPEPRQPSASLQSPSAQVAALMTLAAVESALGELREKHRGPWLLPRVLPSKEEVVDLREKKKKRKRSPVHLAGAQGGRPLATSSSTLAAGRKVEVEEESGGVGPETDGGEEEFFIPPKSRYIQGTIESTRQQFMESDAPLFDLVVLDPPWPNRSAQRKTREDHYRTASGPEDIRRLLSLVPVASRLAPDGLVAVWVTNKPRFVEMLTRPGTGVFASDWGVELVARWTWLKVTTRGEPVVPLHSEFRRPWEQLLVARRRGASSTLGGAPSASPPPWSDKVIVAVPDAHSRKPCVRGLFGGLLPPGYRGLEVFARTLTAGWWSWGDDVLRFQRRKCWVLEDPSTAPSKEPESGVVVREECAKGSSRPK